MGFYDAIDLDFFWDGDLAIGKDGDLKDTSDDLIRSLENEISSLVRSATGDWRLHPDFSADLDDFIGEPNTKRNAKLLEDRVRLKLINAGLVEQRDLTIRVIPTGIHELLVSIVITAVGTARNRLTVGEPLVVSLIYNTMENGLFFLSDQ